MDIVGNQTLRDLWRDLARDAAGEVFLVTEDCAGQVTEHTYGDFAAQVARTGRLLADLGVTRGDTVAVHLPNRPELVQCMVALASIGAVMVPLHPRSSRTECAEIVERVHARVVVCEPAAVDGYRGTAVTDVLVADRGCRDGPDAGADIDAAAPGVEDVVGVSDGLRVTAFAAARDARPAELPPTPGLTSDDPASIVFTSGSTARPKGVVLTHANLLFSGYYVDWQASMRAEDRLLTTMPACHVNFQLNALMPVLTARASLVMVERYSASRFWRQVCDHRATVVQSIAMMVRTQLMQPRQPWEKDHRVREVLYYLPVSDQEIAEYQQRFGVRILNSYGNSECLVGAITDLPVGERRWPSIGRVGLGYHARVVDDEGREGPPGTEGEIQLRGEPGRTLMLGYFEDPEATAAVSTADGWMRTGDVGYQDVDGWFYFVDRSTQMIKRSGENISPARVEAVLTAHPLIADAAVVGIPDPVYDQAVKAVVVPVPGAAVTEQVVRDHCAAHLAEFMVPTVVEIVDHLPRTRSFKVAKGALD